MRIVLQRVQHASVKVDGDIVGQIDKGLMALVCVGDGDSEQVIRKMADKAINLRIFEDENDKMNLSLLDVNGEVLAISQFTLYADCRKGRRPSFRGAAEPEIANRLFELWVEEIRKTGTKVETGVFGAMMDVELLNYGPVTIILDSDEIL